MPRPVVDPPRVSGRYSGRADAAADRLIERYHGPLPKPVGDEIVAVIVAPTRWETADGDEPDAQPN